MSNPATFRPSIADLVGRDGFAFVHEAEMRGVLAAQGLDRLGQLRGQLG